MLSVDGKVNGDVFVFVQINGLRPGRAYLKTKPVSGAERPAIDGREQAQGVNKPGHSFHRLIDDGASLIRHRLSLSAFCASLFHRSDQRSFAASAHFHVAFGFLSLLAVSIFQYWRLA